MNRTVLVTGGGTGIGRAVASAFATDGDAVWITGRRRQPLEETAAQLAGDVMAVVCDHADPAQVEELVGRLPERIDVLVGCAGGNTDFDRPEPQSLEDVAAAWHANLDANLLTTVLTTTAVRDRIPTGGRVITIGSIAADKGAGAYGAAKAGLASWNTQLSAELGPLGITANVVSPGYVAETEFFRDRLDDERRDALVAAADTRAPSVPDDVAAVVFFVASAGARQVTGQTLCVNGGEWPTR